MNRLVGLFGIPSSCVLLVGVHSFNGLGHLPWEMRSGFLLIRSLGYPSWLTKYTSNDHGCLLRGEEKMPTRSNDGNRLWMLQSRPDGVF